MSDGDAEEDFFGAFDDDILDESVPFVSGASAWEPRPWKTSLSELHDRVGGYDRHHSLIVGGAPADTVEGQEEAEGKAGGGVEVFYNDKPEMGGHGGDIERTCTSAWDASLVLSRYLGCAKPSGRFSGFKGATVIELGAGLGVPGLTAAHLGASTVLLTDTAAGGGVSLLHENISINVVLLPVNNQSELAAGGGGSGCAGETKKQEDVLYACELRWGQELSKVEWPQRTGASGPSDTVCAPFDVVIIADLLFSDNATKELVQSVCDVSHEGTVLLSCHEHRWEGAKNLVTLLEEKGWDVGAEVPQSELDAKYRGSDFHTHVCIYRPGAL